MRYVLMLAGVAGAFFLSAARAEDKKDAFVPKDFDGWEGLLKEYWTVKDDGSVVGQTKEKQGFKTFLCSKKKYKDFELSFKVKLTGTGWTGNSGVQIRSKVHDMKKFAVTGPQCDMGGGYWGSLSRRKLRRHDEAAPCSARRSRWMISTTTHQMRRQARHHQGERRDRRRRGFREEG